jgi:predicted amidohydrolase
VKVAAYQAPLLPRGSREAVDPIRRRVDWCESHGVAILCCPEAILGGLADNAADPRESAIAADGDQLVRSLAPLASDTVTTIVGFTEVTGTGRLHNTAAVFHKGSVIGLYRKLYPAINRSIYTAGDRMPVFQIDGLTFGIMICNDSNYPEPARMMAAKGATALFIPTNNGLPPEKADVAAHARKVDVALAREHGVSVIRADVAGRADGMVSYGSSGIVDSRGSVLQSTQPLTEDLIVADLEVLLREPRAIR